MRKAIANLNVEPESLLIDGNYFKPYVNDQGDIIQHECFVKGDDKFQSISAASILAKVYHDEYIEKLVEEEPELKEYGWLSNMCYGTKQHMEGIREYGITGFHRISFAPCKHKEKIDLQIIH